MRPVKGVAWTGDRRDTALDPVGGARSWIIYSLTHGSPYRGRLLSVSEPAPSPVVVDGIVSDEKLGELLALQTEYPELDFKRTLNLRETRDLVELAKDMRRV